MRTFGTYKNKNSGGARATMYKNRETNQWDLRFDLTEDFTAERIVNYIRAKAHTFEYALVSGVEHGAHPTLVDGQWVMDKKTYHVHCCLIVANNIKRHEALAFFREKKQAEEYCTPRNQKFTYLGWRLHHVKTDTKINPEELVLYEHGTLPMDIINEKTVSEIKRMLKKFPGPSDPRYEPYLALASKESSITRKIAKLEEQVKELDQLKQQKQEFVEVRTMGAEDVDAPFILRSQ